MIWILFSLLIILSFACENYCSGHGKCGVKDVCSCFMGWGGICPFGEAFADTPLGNVNHAGSNANNYVKYSTEWTAYGIHPKLEDYVTDDRFHRYAECSNSGICNRKTGECSCGAGFEGSACERRSCPTSSNSKLPCNGHGKCISNYEKYLDYNSNKVGDYRGWEMEKFYVCICDVGFSGYDCSLRTCPIGYSNIDSDTKLSYEAVNDVPAGNKLNEILKAEFYFEVKYDGITYKTQSIINGDCNGKLNNKNTDTIVAENINTALKIVPGFAIESVLVECDENKADANYQSIKILFRSIDPDVKSISVNYVKVTASAKEIVSADLTFKIDDKIPNIDDKKTTECSNKGLCDTVNGVCECFSGYYGAACERDVQTVSI